VLPFAFVDELGRVAADVVRRPGAESLPGYAHACYWASMRSFWSGDLDGWRAFSDLAEAVPGARPLGIMLNVAGKPSMRGDMTTAADIARAVVDHARGRGDPVDLAYTLAILAGFEAPLDAPTGAAHAREAVDIARKTGAQALLVYPLFALASATYHTDPAQTLMTCDECIRIDRTQRRMWSTACRTTAASIHVQRGETAKGLRLYRSALQHFDWIGERLQISLVLEVMAEALTTIDRQTAIQLAAISESGVIAPMTPFDSPQFPNLAATIAAVGNSQLEAARSTAGAMSYDDALRFAFATIDRLTDESPEPSR
jgi:hypothetical protein